jgi:secreted PhoX family phosphatase
MSSVREGMSRRSMLGRSAGVGIALSGTVSGLFGAGTAPAGAGDRVGKAPKGRAGYGPLVDDPAGLLSLPAGFGYTIVAQSGVTTLESGEPTPSDPDGTASFVRHGGNGSVLVVNHEVEAVRRSPCRAWPGSRMTRRPAAARRPWWSTSTAVASAST